MVLESIAAIHTEKGRKSDKYRQTLNLCQILENHPIKLIFSGFLIDILTYICLVQFWDSVVKNCQKICWFDMEWPCFEVKVNVYSYEMKYFITFN